VYTEAQGLRVSVMCIEFALTTLHVFKRQMGSALPVRRQTGFGIPYRAPARMPYSDSVISSLPRHIAHRLDNLAFGDNLTRH
jgi:hypothetical protein